MNKKSLSGRLSGNPVRISLRPSSVSEETHIPRPRVRSSSVDATGRKSSLKLPTRVQQSQYGFGTPQTSTSATPSASQIASTVRSLCPPGSGMRGRSPSAERASSIAPKVTRKDNRPLGEKSFQAEMLSKIDSYLRSIDKSDLVNSNRSIKPITLKMFVEVSGLLVKLLDIKQPLNMVNYVEELPKIAKKLHYPGQMNKSWLKTANAMHSWPQVLGWLSWLAEACAVRDIAAEDFLLENLPFIESDNSTEGFNRIRFQFLLDAYKAWNEEKPDEEAALTEAYLKKVAAMQGISDLDMENAMKECENEKLLLEDAKSKSQELEDDIKQIEQTSRSLRDIESKCEARIKELQDIEKNCSAETQVIEKKTTVLHKTLEKKKAREKELKVQISSQSMSVSERDEILERCRAMQDQMRELDKHMTDIEKEMYSLDIKLASTRNTLNKVAFAYNKDIYMHLGNEAGINWKDIVLPITGISTPHIMEELENKAKLMADFRKNKEKEIKIMEVSIEENEKKVTILEAEKVALECKKEECLAKINEKKNQIDTIRIAAKAKEVELKKSIEDLKQKIKDTEESIPDIEQDKNEFEEAKEKLQAVIRRKDYLEESARLFFDKMFEILANQNNRLASLFDKVSGTD